MIDIKFQRFLNTFLKERHIHNSIHIIDCLIISMEAAAKEIEPENRDLALAMYALYLKPYDLMIREHPRYDEFEDLYLEALKHLAESDLECPCSVCPNIGTITVNS